MWKATCDCCGKIEHGISGEPILPTGWHSIKWKREGTNNMGLEARDDSEFFFCVACIQHWPYNISQIRLSVRYAINNLETAHALAKGFGNNGNEAAAHIERALEYLGERMKP